MKFEVIRKSHKKEIMIGTCIFIILAVVLIVKFTFAKYELVKSIKIAEGTINYKVPDFKIMAMYKQKDDATCSEDSCYNKMAENEIMPESGYTINESKSYCTLDNVNKDTKAKLFTNEEGKHVISGLSKSSKCYIYFDKKLSAGETILGNVTVNEGTPDFSQVATTDEGVYKAKDESGSDSYYFRGAVDNNYVKFAGFWWRIVRINGDGSIRLIYDGTEAHANGEVTPDSIAVANVKWSHKDAYWKSSTDNAYINDNAYTGFQYTIGSLRGLGTKSNALQELESWYTSNLSSYAAKIDNNAGFCGDRTPYTDMGGTTSGGGIGTTLTYYGANIRLITNKSPILTCADTNDLYTVSSSNKGNKTLTYPIGLITADEVAMAGGVWNTENKSYYLYNGQYYWTLSPSYFDDSYAVVFGVRSTGNPARWSVNNVLGVRPVINLRSDIKISGNGTISNPYVVE